VAKQGCISVISPEGKLLQDIAVPAPELTGITINPQQNALFVTEASTNSIYRLPIVPAAA
jgi:sugar lactone lactonase YvrE